MGAGDSVSLLDPLFRPGLIAGVAVAVLCAPLSVFVVLKRLAFMGQGVSHAAFGGVGIALVLGIAGAGAFGVVAGFCIAAALGIAWLSDRRTTQADTVIGVVLVGSMALGAILVSMRFRTGGAPAFSWEDLLFGSLMTVDGADAAIAWACAGGIILLLLWRRRALLFWAFDESVAEAFGSPTRATKMLLMTLLAVATVVAMKLAGVVLATALLVLPGATALRLSRRLSHVMGISFVVSIAGMIGGLAASFALNLPPGACVVAALTAMFGATWPLNSIRTQAARARGAIQTGDQA